MVSRAKKATKQSQESNRPTAPQPNSPSTSSGITDYSISTPETQTRVSRSKKEIMFVKLPFGKPKSAPCKRRSNALKVARNKIDTLKSKVTNLTRSTRKWQKRCERISNTKQKATPSKMSKDATPKTKTRYEIRKAGISPRSVPRSLVRKLEMFA